MDLNAATTLLKEWLDKQSMTQEEFQALYDYCSNRNYGEASVAVYLMLDDLTEEGKNGPIVSGDPLYNFMLATGATELLSHLKQDGSEITDMDVAKAFELLAEKVFTVSRGTVPAPEEA